MWRKVALLLVALCCKLFGVGLDWFVFFQPDSETVLTKFVLVFVVGEDVVALRDDEVWLSHFDVDVFITGKDIFGGVVNIHRDWSRNIKSDYQYKNVIDRFFVWLPLMEGKVKVIWYDYFSGDQNEVEVPIKIAQVVNEWGIGTTLHPLVWSGGERYESINGYIPASADSVELELWIYNYQPWGLKLEAKIEVNGAIYRTVVDTGTWIMRVFVPMDSVEIGDLPIKVYLLGFDSSAVEYRLFYVFQSNHAYRMCLALKLITRKWEDYFKGLDERNAGRLLYRFIAKKYRETDFTYRWYQFTQRFEYAEKYFYERFGHKKGFETDRGMMLIIFGFPDEVETYEWYGKKYMDWIYFNRRFKITFVEDAIGGDGWLLLGPVDGSFIERYGLKF